MNQPSYHWVLFPWTHPATTELYFHEPTWVLFPWTNPATTEYYFHEPTQLPLSTISMNQPSYHWVLLPWTYPATTEYYFHEPTQLPLSSISTNQPSYHWVVFPRWMDGWVSILRPFNSISVISRRWKGEHERLCAMKRRLGSGRISPPAGFEPATQWSEVGSANRSANPATTEYYFHWVLFPWTNPATTEYYFHWVLFPWTNPATTEYYFHEPTQLSRSTFLLPVKYRAHSGALSYLTIVVLFSWASPATTE